MLGTDMKASAMASDGVGTICDFLVWYCRDRAKVKLRNDINKARGKR
jgi:hypothetical protein